MPRRTALAIGLASLASTATLNVVATPPAFAGEADDAIGTREWDFKTYKLIAPDVYDEVNVPLANPANGVASPTVLLLKALQAQDFSCVFYGTAQYDSFCSAQYDSFCSAQL